MTRMKMGEGTGHNRFVRRGPTLSGLGEGRGHQDYGQNFIGFKIRVETDLEIFSQQESVSQISSSFSCLGICSTIYIICEFTDRR